MKYTFSENQGQLSCNCGNQRLTLVRPQAFSNLQSVFHEGNLLFDGYSMFFRGEAFPCAGQMNFSVSLCFLPLTFSGFPDGLISCWSEENTGLEILLEKGGILRIRLGFGATSLSFPSCNAHVHAGKQNTVTVVYHGDAGWCDLYVNGLLSNRKQFRRHTGLPFPDTPWYLGNRVCASVGSGHTPFGYYYGFMNWFSTENRALTVEEVALLHRQTDEDRFDGDPFALGMPDRRCYRADRHRPQYHLSPPGKWMNEPHAPLFYRGLYHIFYQANPHAPLWDHLSWGHLVSQDMLCWEDMPLALQPEAGTVAPDGCWSGSAMIDKAGNPRIYFTAGDNRRFPNQSVALATPSEAGDPRLPQWEQLSRIIQSQDVGWMGEFRDPFVWLENDTYYMLVGTGDSHNGGGNAALYTSDDGLRWIGHGMLVDYDYAKNRELGHVWELPVLLPLRSQNGQIACHILLLCACQIESDIVETYYFLGHWDAQTCTFTKYHEKARLIDLGKGTFTGPSGFVTPDGRSVLFTIAQGHRTLEAECHAGWAHNGGLPLELFWHNGDLGIQPIRELRTLRGRQLLELAQTEKATCNRLLRSHRADRLCTEVTALQPAFGLILSDGCQSLEVRYDLHSKRVLVLDQEGRHLERYRGIVDAVDIGQEPIRFSCYLDHSMLEVYVNDRKSVSLRNYFQGERFFQVSADVAQLSLWEMNPAYHSLREIR